MTLNLVSGTETGSTNEITVSSKDSSGNPTTNDSTFILPIDNIAPTVSIAAGPTVAVGGEATFTITITDQNLNANFTPTTSSGTVTSGACTTASCPVTVTGFNSGSLTLTVATGEVTDLAGNTNGVMASDNLTVSASDLSVSSLPMATSLNAANYTVSGNCESTQGDVTVTVGTPNVTQTGVSCSGGNYSTTVNINSVTSSPLVVTVTQSTNTVNPSSPPENDQDGPTSAPLATAPSGYVGGASYDLAIGCNEAGEKVSITGSGIQNGTQNYTCGGAGSESVTLTLQQNTLLSSNSLTIDSKDEHDNPAGTSTSVNFPVDTKGPTVTITDGGDVGVGGSATFNITVADVNLPSSWNYTPTVNSGTLSPTSCTANPCQLTVTGANSGTLTLTVGTNSISDDLGNTGPSSNETQSLTVRPPATITGTSITSNDGDGDNWYEDSDTVTIQVSFSEAISVTGSPTIPVTLGSSTTKQAIYSSSDSGSTSLAFQFTIASGDEDCNGDVSLGSLDVTSASITSVSGGTNTNNSGLVNTLSGVQIDAQPPTLSTLSLTTDIYASVVDAAEASWTVTEACNLTTSMALSTHNGTSCDSTNSIAGYEDIENVTTFQPQSEMAPFGDFTLIFTQDYCLRVKVVDAAGNEAISASANWSPQSLSVSGNIAEFPDGTYADHCLEYSKSPHYNSADDALGNGSYNIDPDGDGTAIVAYCDMENGGWTLVAQRAGTASSSNAETCTPTVSNLGEFFGGACGSVTNLAYGDGYSIGDSTVRTAIIDEGNWKFEQSDSSAAVDSDDMYIITQDNGTDLFPASSGTLTLSRISVDSVCDKDGACDTSGVQFLWLPDKAFENSSAAATCDGTLDSSSSQKGNYGYCHDGSATNAVNSLFGDRSGYSESKAWGNTGAQAFNERIWVK